MTTRIRKLGNELAVILPTDVVVRSGLAENAEVAVTLEHGAVIARPVTARLRYSLDELLKTITDDQLHPEIRTGPPVGREEW